MSAASHDGLGGPALVRIKGAGGASRCVLWRDGQSWELGPRTFDELLRLPLREIRAILEDTLRGSPAAPVAAKTELAAPIGSQEVWAAGVTYRRSREARLEESSETRFYDRVYTSDRPELFFKAAGWRAVGPGGEVGVRADSTWDVPEPELAVLSNRHGEVVAYACANDMSSRSIEGENPLFLPQAKVYDRSCAIGPAAVLAWTVDVSHAGMRMLIERDGRPVFSGTTSVAEMTREPAKLVAVLHAAYTLPVGAWLLTGTGIVPPEGYTARPGDLVRIAIDGLGELVNRVSLVPHSGAEARPTRRAAEHD